MLKTLLSHDFRHTAINQFWRLVSGPVILILIPIFLTQEEQGYWYTFIGLAALAVFADMGFSTIILQFSAHEFAYLKFDENKLIIGNQNHIERIATLLKFAMKWSLCLGLIVFPIILLVGYFVLNKNETQVLWVVPWVIYGISSTFVFLNSILLSFIEGCDSVGDIQKIRFQISMISSIAIIIFLSLHTKLYALAVSLCLMAILGTILILHKYFFMLKQLFIIANKVSYDWGKEIFPLLGRYAISWISGYFIFYIFNPVAFSYYGAVEAGKVGISFSLWMAIFNMSNIWMVIITPKINMCVSQRNYKLLDSFFFKHLLFSVLTYILGSIIVFYLYYFVGEIKFITDRFVEPLPMFMLFIVWLVQLVVNSLAIYIRAHKVEPLVLPSFLSAIFVILSTFILSINFEFKYYFAGIFFSTCLFSPWILYIFYKYKGGLFVKK